jgi:hypothetical protein
MSVDVQEAHASWTIVHMVFVSLKARMRLLTVQGSPVLPLEEPDVRWFFVDIPITTAGGSFHGLEFAILHRDCNEAIRKRLNSWISDAFTAGLLLTATFAKDSVVMEPSLFLDSFVPGHYPEALAVASARAGIILASVAKRRGIRATAAAVKEELAGIYRAFLPDHSERAHALRSHAEWLECFCNRRTDPIMKSEKRVVKQKQYRDELKLSILKPYESVAEQLNAEIRGKNGESCGGSRFTCSKLCTTLLARFAHIQVVRLWGPEYPDALLKEAKILRDLAAIDLSPFLEA